MIYIQKADGLQAISSQLTKEKIIAALGYTPADQNTFWEDESGALIVADQAGHVIARIDADGFETTTVSAKAIQLDGKDLEAKLQELIDAIPEVDLSGLATQKYVDDAVANIDIPEINTDGLATEEALNAHVNNTDVHFSGNYSDLSGAPNASNDNEEELIICDASGNVIMRVNANGLNAANVYVNGKAIGNPVFKFMIDGFECEMDTSVQRWSDWVNSPYNTINVEAHAEFGIVKDGYEVCLDGNGSTSIKNPNSFIMPGYTYVLSSISHPASN